MRLARTIWLLTLFPACGCMSLVGRHGPGPCGGRFADIYPGTTLVITAASELPEIAGDVDFAGVVGALPIVTLVLADFPLTVAFDTLLFPLDLVRFLWLRSSGWQWTPGSETEPPAAEVLPIQESIDAAGE